MIYHYTTIGALASILRYRTIRFSRLNTLDDTQEEQRVGDYEFGAKLYVSCWVDKEEEDIAQWAMYGHAMRGVRLSLPRQPFAIVPRFGGTTALPPHLHFDGYSLLPDCGADEDFIRRVHYVENVESEYGARVDLLAEGGCRVRGRLTDLATFKNRRWSFQQECRFILHAAVGPPRCSDQREWARRFAELARTPQWQYGGPSTQHIDLPLDGEAFSRAEVVLGPLANESDWLVVESLIATLAAGIQLRRSELTGLIRHRQG